MKSLSPKEDPIQIIKVVPKNQVGGWVAITTAPDKKGLEHSRLGKQDLEANLDRLKSLRVSTLVPLIEDAELANPKIQKMMASAEKRNFSVRRYPFQEGGVPENLGKTVRFIREMLDRYETGEHIVIHCNSGVGRAGTIAACIRLALDLDSSPEEAIASVRKIRSDHAIENPEQQEFVSGFYKAWFGR